MVLVLQVPFQEDKVGTDNSQEATRGHQIETPRQAMVDESVEGEERGKK